MTLDASNFPLAKAPWNPAVPDLCYGWLPYLTVVRRPKACAPSASQYSNDWTASDKCTLPAGAVPVPGIPGVYQRPESDGSVSWWMCSRVEIPDSKLSRGENSKCVESITVGPGSNWPAGTYCKAVWDLGGPFKVWPDGSFSSGGTALLFQGTPTSFEQLRNVRVSLAYRRWIELLPQEDFIKSLPPELAVVLYYSLGRFDDVGGSVQIGDLEQQHALSNENHRTHLNQRVEGVTAQNPLVNGTRRQRSARGLVSDLAPEIVRGVIRRGLLRRTAGESEQSEIGVSLKRQGVGAGRVQRQAFRSDQVNERD